MPQSYSWEIVFELAVSETDPVRTGAYVEAAETLIFVRGQQKKAECKSCHGDEKRSIDSTLRGLLLLKSAKLGWPMLDDESLNGSKPRQVDEEC